MRSNLLFVLVVCGVVVVGCGGEKNRNGTISVSLPGSFKIEVTIDANGGEIIVRNKNSTIDGARLKVEKNALTGATKITLEEGPVDQDVQGESSLLFGPSGTVFTKPASATATYTDEFVQKYEVDPQEMLLVLDNGDDIVEVIQPTSIDTVGRKVNGEIDHFSLLRAIDHRIFALMLDPYAFLDGTPIPITTVIPQTSGATPIPLITRSKIQTTITLGKGKLSNIKNPGERTIFLLPGLTAPPTTYYYKENSSKENPNDFSSLFRNDPAFSSMYDNVVYFKYPTGRPIEEVAKHFATLFRLFVPQGTRVDLLGHSLGCMVIRQAIQVEGISPSVEDVFFLGGPHEGGELSKFITTFTRDRFGNLIAKNLIPSGEQVTIGSKFITNLNANFPGKKLASTKYHFVASKTDELINPNSGIPAFMNPSPADTLLIDNETHWGIHGNAKTNGVAHQIRLWKGYPPLPLQPTIAWANVYAPIGSGSGASITSIAIDPKTPTTVYAVQNNYSSGGARIFKTIDGGINWMQVAQRIGRVSAFMINPATPMMLFAAGEQSGVEESSDGGQTWANPKGLQPSTVKSIAIAADGSYLLAAGSFLNKKIGAAGWLSTFQPTGLPRSSGPSRFPVEPRTVAIDPITPSTAYIGTYTTGGYSTPVGEGVYKTTDEGQTWTVTGLDTGNMSALVIDPKTPTTVYAVEYHDRIYKTTNGGRSWIPLSGTGPYVEMLAIDPRDPSILYTASKDVAYRSQDGGNTWVDVSTGFPANTIIWTFAVDPATGAVYAGTSNGIFKTQ